MLPRALSCVLSGGSDDNVPMALAEITEPIDLCWPDGRLRPQAVGWTRQPLHRSSLRRRGRTKRWEYWAVMSPEAFLGITVSDLDYAGLFAAYFLDESHRETVRSALVPLARLGLPDRSGGGPVSVKAKGLAIDLTPDGDRLSLEVRSPGLEASITVTRPAGHESLGVVVPWSGRRFQYTVKENTLPAFGEVHCDGVTTTFGDGAWATLDHGRGAWPYRITWNWGSGSGVRDGHVIGVQLGGRWTDGTGSTENALCLDGRLHYIPHDLVWTYDRHDWMRPWHIRDPRGGRVDVTFLPEHVREDRINLGILANDTHQAFGTFEGTMRTDDLTPVDVTGIRGWVEEVRNRW